MTSLDEIRGRDAARGDGRGGVTMTQSEADRRVLLKLLDEMTRCRDAAVRLAERDDIEIGFDLEDRLRDGLAGIAEWNEPEPDRAPDWLIDAVTRIVRPELARLTENLWDWRPRRVVHVVRTEGPTSEVFAAFLDDSDLERWVEWNRTPAWTHVQIAPLEYPPSQPPPEMTLPPAQWCRAYGVTILDPDGWRHGNAHPWDAPVTLVEFSRRAAMSTTDAANPAWEGVDRDLKAQQAAAQRESLPGIEGAGQ